MTTGEVEATTTGEVDGVTTSDEEEQEEDGGGRALVRLFVVQRGTGTWQAVGTEAGLGASERTLLALALQGGKARLCPTSARSSLADQEGIWSMANAEVEGRWRSSR